MTCWADPTGDLAGAVPWPRAHSCAGQLCHHPSHQPRTPGSWPWAICPCWGQRDLGTDIPKLLGAINPSILNIPGSDLLAPSCGFYWGALLGISVFLLLPSLGFPAWEQVTAEGRGVVSPLLSWEGHRDKDPTWDALSSCCLVPGSAAPSGDGCGFQTQLCRHPL